MEFWLFECFSVYRLDSVLAESLRVTIVYDCS